MLPVIRHVHVYLVIVALGIIVLVMCLKAYDRLLKK
jgi:hypothetical protein